jgi:glycosyltransferase involved in cell wall biosynthesis
MNEASDLPHDLTVDTGGGRLDDLTPSEERPLVSVVVTTYDRFEQATRAIRSARSQTYAPMELLVVEDGTDSGVQNWLDQVGYDDVRYVRHATNRGLSAARNTALALTTGRYVAYLDDDDEWKSERVERGVGRFRDLSDERHDRTAVVYCAVESREGGTVASIVPPENEGVLADAIRRQGPSTLPSSFLFRRAALETVGGFDESLASSVDHDLWMALAVAGYQAQTIDEPLVVTYDEFVDSMMTDTESRIEGVTQFVEKWRPTYHEWFGNQEGERRIRRYYVDVIGRLFATKLVTGRFGEAQMSARSVLNVTDRRAYVLRSLGVRTIEAAVKRFLPAAVVRRLARVRRATA